MSSDTGQGLLIRLQSVPYRNPSRYLISLLFFYIFFSKYFMVASWIVTQYCILLEIGTSIKFDFCLNDVSSHIPSTDWTSAPAGSIASTSTSAIVVASGTSVVDSNIVASSSWWRIKSNSDTSVVDSVICRVSSSMGNSVAPSSASHTNAETGKMFKK